MPSVVNVRFATKLCKNRKRGIFSSLRPLNYSIYKSTVKIYLRDNRILTTDVYILTTQRVIAKHLIMHSNTQTTH